VLKLRRGKREERELARDICAALMVQARDPAFYVQLQVPDTLDGRFDLAVLHAFLVLERLRSAGQSRVAQALVDELFAGFDDALRQLGASDMSMGRKLKKMADAFYGRLSAYSAAHEPDALAAAICRNVYRGDEARTFEATRLATYALVCRSHLGDWVPEDGPPSFDRLPEIVSA
jgi:cytochrome b pre-mRNA-processing protein 3